MCLRAKLIEPAVGGECDNLDLSAGMPGDLHRKIGDPVALHFPRDVMDPTGMMSGEMGGVPGFQDDALGLFLRQS